MNVTTIIKYPILTEKVYAQMENNVYTFAVDLRADKLDIKRAIEFIFECKVKKVNVMTIRKKPKRVGRFLGEKTGYKKAIITLKEGKIKIFEDEVKKEVKKDKDTSKVDESKLKSLEEKVQAKIDAAKDKKENQIQKTNTDQDKKEVDNTKQPEEIKNKDEQKEEKDEGEK
ncbi:MAG: 50S ribosomal protein L23 [Mycoplasma sp.]|nr:50S ribosomal protein L23 [Mycoplasma sp.]